MENILISLNAVLPMFLIILEGHFIRRLHIVSISDTSVREATDLCFKLFLFVLVFKNIYTSDIRSTFNVPLLALCLGGVALEFIIGQLLIPRIEKAPSARGVMLQAFFRSNTVLLGLPISTALFGPEQAGQISVILAFTIPPLNILSVVALELHRGGKPNPRKILRGIVTNPIVLGCAAGLLTVLLRLRLPVFLESAVSSLAAAATPLSLVLMGAAMNFDRVRGSIRNLIICTLERLIIAPGIMLALGAAMGFRGVALCALLVVFATPVAVNSHTMALHMDGDADLAGSIVLLTTALSCLTMFLWILLLKNIGWF